MDPNQVLRNMISGEKNKKTSVVCCRTTTILNVRILLGYVISGEEEKIRIARSDHCVGGYEIGN